MITNSGELTKKIRVGVLMGGQSIEREVSFNSGRTVCDHIDLNLYDVVPLFQAHDGVLYILPWYFLHRGKISDFEYRLATQATAIIWDDLKTLVDFVYIAMHGRYVEDGGMQGMLEVLNIPYFGSKVFGSALGMNKAMNKQWLASYGIDVPAGIIIQPHEADALTVEAVVERLARRNVSLPVVVKPSQEGSSFGITVVEQLHELIPAIGTARRCSPGIEQTVLVEEKLIGDEFTIMMLERFNDQNKPEWFALPITYIMLEENKKIYDYDQKYMPGRATKITPAPFDAALTTAIETIARRVTDVLNFQTLSRIDGFVTTTGRIVITDPNSFAGMGPTAFIFDQAAEYGMNHTQLINFLINTELKHYGMNIDIKSDGQGLAAAVPKKRVVVLMGGDSNEREVSFDSGRNVSYKISRQHYEVIPVFVTEDMDLYHMPPNVLIKNSTRDVMRKLTPELKISWDQLPKIADFVYLGLHGGKGECGEVQGALELLGLPYNGSGPLTSALCMDKYKTAHFLRALGFDVPQSRLIGKEPWNNALTAGILDQFCAAQIEGMDFPLIVKPHDDGCSVMVSKVHDNAELMNAINGVLATSKEHALVEEFVQGMELTVGVMGNDQPRALPPSKAVAAASILSMEEKFLPGAGENITPAPLPSAALQRVQRTMEAVYAALDCKGYVRIDCFYQDATTSPTGNERVVILEINTLPALTPATCLFHQLAEVGIRPMEFFDQVITMGLELHQRDGVRPTEPQAERPVKAYQAVV